MIDFQNSSVFKLKSISNNAYAEIISPIFVNGEEIISSYQGMRDGVVFTNKRILAINIKGVTGKKKDISSLPYSKVQAFSIETAGVMDLDSELEIWFSGLGSVKFEFAKDSNVSQIGRIISEYVL